MEDFTKQELRPLIYRERTDIEDFDIDNPKSLDAVMYDRITSSKIVEFEGAPEYILDIFNNAYYITTLILMEKRPILYQSRYFLIAEHTSSAYEDINEKNNFYRYFESMIMAMVCNYLRVLRPDIYTDMQKSKMLNAIWSYHDSNNVMFGRNTEGRSLFYHNILHPTELKKYSVNKNDFKPLHTAKELMAMEIQDLEDVGNANNSKSVNNDLQIEEVEELKAKVETLQTKLKDAQEALDVYKNAKNINWHDKVRLELAIRIMEEADINLETYGNKAKAARILQAITKLPISTCSNYASNRDLSVKQHSDEIEKINSDLRVLNKEIQL